MTSQTYPRRALAPGRFPLTFAVPVTLMMTGPAGAQDGIILDPVTLTATSGALDLGRASGAGSRLGLSVLDTPASVEVIDGRVIRERGQTDINQAIVRNATGLSYNGSPGNGGTSLSMRGFSGHGSVTRLYDGTRLYPASGTITFPADSWNVQRVEVLHGPAGVLYGEGGVGGAINIVPKKPALGETRNEARLIAGTDGLLGLATGIAAPLGEQMAYSLDVSRTRSDGWVDRGESSNLAVSAALLWQVTDDVKVTFSHDHAMTRPMRYFGTPLVDGALDERVRRRNYNVADARVRYRDNFTQLKAEWTPVQNVTVTSTLYTLNSDRDWRNVEDYTFNPSTGRVDRAFYIAINHLHEQVGNRTDLRIDSTPGGMEMSTVLGVDLNRIRFWNTNNSPYPGSSSVDYLDPQPGGFGPYPMTATVDTTTRQVALFLDNRLKINDQWSLVGGLRHDKLSVSRVTPDFSKDLDSTSWRLGVVYNPTADTALYAQVSRAAEPIGNVLSLSQSQADLKLTTARQVEMGVKAGFWDGRGDATLSAFRIVKNDLLARDPDDPSQVVQIGQQSAQGVEAAIGLDVTPAVRLDANLALISPRYDRYVQSTGDLSGNRPPNAPRRVANLWASWEVAPDWTLRGGLHHVGEVFTSPDNSTTRPSYTVVNAGVSWRPSATWNVDFTVDNLTDAVYATSGGATQWMLGAPRSAALTLNARF